MSLYPVKTEIKTYFGQCRCCLGYAYLKNMWTEQLNEGKKEIFGQMLVDCFSITWTIQGEVEDDKVCEDCISKLREAYKFKNQVMKSHEDLKQNGSLQGRKVSRVGRPRLNFENEDDSDNEGYTQEKVIKDELEPMDDKDFENVEFLDEDIIENDINDSQSDTSVRKRHMYKKYTDHDMKAALMAVRMRGMPITQAAQTFNIPRKTIDKKARDPVKESIDRAKQNEFINGVKAILTHTNATPFRRKVNGYFCFFCSRKAPAIGSPEELRTHTHTVHWDKVTQVEFAMRPHHSNLTIRFDLEDLTCKICDAKESWEDMLDHLSTEHGVDLEEARNRIVPFILGVDQMTCVLCDFTACFTLMDSHMNSHFKNYICGECGDSFLTAARLHCHSRTHQLGVFPCDHCHKIFTRQLYRRKHIDLVHTKRLLYKCKFCDERYPTEGLRYNHVKEKHMDKLQSKAKTCKECNKTFWPMAYYQHMRRLHNETFICSECGKSFVTQKVLEEHKMRHTGVKNFKCDTCGKTYFSKAAVHMHKKYKHNLS